MNSAAKSTRRITRFLRPLVLPVAQSPMQSSTSRVWFVLALFSLSVLVSCDSGGGTPEPDEPSELGVEVTGTVTSAENDEPIGGVSVEVLRADNGNALASATTDTTGSYEATFTIEEPDAPDQIRLELSAEGFVDKEVSTGFQPSVTEDVTLEAASVEATVSGAVTENGTGDPIEGASVTGTRPDGGEQLFETTTSSDGSYEVTFEVADEPDEVAIQADAQGFEAADTTVSFSEQISADLGLQVATTQAIASGTVTNEDTGDPIEGATVTGTRPDGGDQLFQATTSSDGTYDVTFEVADEPSEIEISANADGFEMASQTVTFSGDISASFELPSATTQSTASGQVTREDNGDPIGGASVTGTRAGSGEKLFETTTASDGTYEATFGVTDEPSEVTIQADAENFESGEQTVNFGEQITADFSLQPATIEATASGTVSRSDSGDPIEGATVTGTRAGSGEQLFQATTSSDGSYQASYSVKATNEPSDIALSANATNFKSADKTVSFSEEITGDLQLEPKTTESTASGTVTRSDTGDPIEDATITGTRPDTGEQLFETTSSSDGSYEASFEVEATDEPSDVTLSAGAADFNSKTSTVNFSQEITTDFALEVATTEATASGTVSRSDSGDPIEGATVTATRPDTGEQLFETTTSSDGSYQASFEVKTTNEPSDVDFAVSAGDFTSGGATVAFAEEIARDFQLEPKTTEATVSGAVTRSDNSDPIDGATVTGSPAGGSEKLFETTTNASGEYETTFEVKVPDEPDQISVTANSGDYDGSEKTVDFGSAITTDFALDPSEVNVTIDGTITAKLDGSTVEGGEVSAFRPNGSGALASTTSEMGGAYSLSFTVLAPDAPDELRIEATEQRFSDATMTVGFSESIGQDIALSSIEISTIDELQAIQTDSDFPLDGYYKQTADIDASGFGSFQPIGDDTIPFSGKIDGNGFVIDGLTIDRASEDDVALIRRASGGSLLRSVVLRDIDIDGQENVAGLVATDIGADIDGPTIRDSKVTGSISGFAVAGLISNSRGAEIHDSEFSGTLTGSGGGLVSRNRRTDIYDSESHGTIRTDVSAGGLVLSIKNATIARSISTMDILVRNPDFSGGAVGGIARAANSNSTIRKSIATGRVEGEAGSSSNAGGLVGEADFGARIEASYASGPVSGAENVGGLVGSIRNEAKVVRSYSSGDISNGENIGGVVGTNGSDITESYWDTEASGQSSGVGRGDATGTTGLTTSEMQGNSAEENMDGFDFQNTWRVVMGDYPALQWEE